MQKRLLARTRAHSFERVAYQALSHDERRAILQVEDRIHWFDFWQPGKIQSDHVLKKTQSHSPKHVEKAFAHIKRLRGRRRKTLPCTELAVASMSSTMALSLGFLLPVRDGVFLASTARALQQGHGELSKHWIVEVPEARLLACT